MTSSRSRSISKTSASVSSGFQTRETETNESTRPQLFQPRWNTKYEFLKSLLQQKKISLNYHWKVVSIEVLFMVTGMWICHLLAVCWLLIILNFFCICFSHCYLLVVLWVYRASTLLLKMAEYRFREPKTLVCRRGRVCRKCSSKVDAIQKQMGAPYFWQRLDFRK